MTGFENIVEAMFIEIRDMHKQLQSTCHMTGQELEDYAIEVARKHNVPDVIIQRIRDKVFRPIDYTF